MRGGVNTGSFKREHGKPQGRTESPRGRGGFHRRHDGAGGEPRYNRLTGERSAHTGTTSANRVGNISPQIARRAATAPPSAAPSHDGKTPGPTKGAAGCRSGGCSGLWRTTAQSRV